MGVEVEEEDKEDEEEERYGRCLHDVAVVVGEDALQHLPKASH